MRCGRRTRKRRIRTKGQSTAATARMRGGQAPQAATNGARLCVFYTPPSDQSRGSVRRSRVTTRTSAIAHRLRTRRQPQQQHLAGCAAGDSADQESPLGNGGGNHRSTEGGQAPGTREHPPEEQEEDPPCGGRLSKWARSGRLCVCVPTVRDERRKAPRQTQAIAQELRVFVSWGRFSDGQKHDGQPRARWFRFGIAPDARSSENVFAGHCVTVSARSELCNAPSCTRSV